MHTHAGWKRAWRFNSLTEGLDPSEDHPEVASWLPFYPAVHRHSSFLDSKRKRRAQQERTCGTEEVGSLGCPRHSSPSLSSPPPNPGTAAETDTQPINHLWQRPLSSLTMDPWRGQPGDHLVRLCQTMRPTLVFHNAQKALREQASAGMQAWLWSQKLGKKIQRDGGWPFRFLEAGFLTGIQAAGLGA